MVADYLAAEYVNSLDTANIATKIITNFISIIEYICIQTSSKDERIGVHVTSDSQFLF